MASNTQRQDLDFMAKNLSQEVMAQFNMSVKEYFSHISAVSLRPFRVDTSTNASQAEDKREVMISRGLVWTLVAPLIFLGLLIVAGVTIACLLKLTDRRCYNKEAQCAGREGEIITDEMELQDLQGKFTRPVSRIHGIKKQHENLWNEHWRYPQMEENEVRACSYSLQQRPPCFPGGRDQNRKEIHLPVLKSGVIRDEMWQENREEMWQEKPVLEQAGLQPELGHRQYCGGCQNQVSWGCIYGNHYPNPQSRRSTRRYLKHTACNQDVSHCKFCTAHHTSKHYDVGIRKSHTDHLSLAQRSSEALPHLASLTTNDHLHFIPRNHTAKINNCYSGHPGNVQKDDLKTAELTKYRTTQDSRHGVENQLFSADDGKLTYNISDYVKGKSSGNTQKERARGGRGKRISEEKQNGFHLTNSTAVLSSLDRNSSGVHHPQGDSQHKRRVPCNGKPEVECLNDCSIKPLSGASYNWRASRRVLPTAVSSSNTPSCKTHSSSNDREEILSLPSSISRFHASRMQFPPLLPDALYPLTSTKASSSPAWTSDCHKGEDQTVSTRGGIYQTADISLDNTSLQPNVGSSWTSGGTRPEELRKSDASNESYSKTRVKSARQDFTVDWDMRKTQSSSSESVFTEKKASKKGDSLSMGTFTSANDLRHAMNRLKTEHHELPESERKHGYLLIPKQSLGNGVTDHQNQHIPPYDISNQGEKPKSRSLTSPYMSGQQQSCEDVMKQTLDTSHQMLDRLRQTSNTQSPGKTESRTNTAGEKLPLNWSTCSGQEQHPTKLYSCRRGKPQSDLKYFQNLQKSHREKLHKDKLSSSNKENETSNTEARRVEQTRNQYLPLPRRISLKTNNVFPSSFDDSDYQEMLVDAGAKRCVMKTLSDNRKWNVSRVNLEQATSHEDHAYINMGSSLFEENQLAGWSRTSPSVAVCTSRQDPTLCPAISVPLVVSDHKSRRCPLAKTKRQHVDHSSVNYNMSNEKTESEIMADVISSFSRPALSENIDVQTTLNNSFHGSIDSEMVMPTAFAEKLFGIWTLSPEQDCISPSQPRTPLMTPIKGEAKKASSKFTWENSDSHSRSASTSSLLFGWQNQQQEGDSRGCHATYDQNVDEADYMLMDNKRSSSLTSDILAPLTLGGLAFSDRVHSKMSVGNHDKIADFDNVENDKMNTDCKGLPLNIYNISGIPGVEDFKNNPVPELNNWDGRNLLDKGKRAAIFPELKNKGISCDKQCRL